MSNGSAGTSTPNTVTLTSTCSDYIGRPVADSPFSSIQHRLGVTATGVFSTKPAGESITGYVYNARPQGAVWNSVNITPLSVPGDWYTQVVARSNPSRAEVTPFTLIQDFVSLPKMVRDVGRLLTKPAKSLGARDLANQNLALQFGWLPLIDDVHKLLDLQLHTLRRVRELHSLYSSSGLRRRLTLGEDNQSGKYLASEGFGLNTNIFFPHDIRVTRKQWATIHWKPTTPPPYHPSGFEYNKLARRLVLGLTQEGLVNGTWEVLPWTWLTDWFVNVGGFLAGFSNTVPASHSSACLMNEVKATFSAAPAYGAWALTPGTCSVVNKGVQTYSSKTRTLSGSVVPGFNIPFIGMNRLSILGSLYVQRFAR